jgi:D-alanyl-lipoteichoic acid acyltransferase DltB (MBOAT superfamily)
MFAEINSASFFIDLLALSLVLVPLTYFIKCTCFRETALTFSGAYLLYFIAPRLVLFYLVFWSLVFILQQIVARTNKHKLNTPIFWVCLVMMLAPMVTWKLAYEEFTILFNLISNDGIKLFSETLWKIDLARAIIIPIGLSFATFRGADLLIKSWLGKFEALPINKIFFYGLFPSVQAVGPIIEYEELQKHETPKADDIYNGLMRISFGLIKVLLLAAILQKSAAIFQNYETASVVKIWGFLIIYTWFFYLNFSGFSDMAIGIARLYGYKLKENFCFPYFRRNIAEFWNNWHMSLSRFAQRSAFVPLGGYRKKTQYIATLGTIFVIALWHDISWGMVLFALYHGTGLIIHRYWSDKRGKVDDNNIVLNWTKIFATYFYVLLSFPLLVMPLDKAGDFYLSLVGM